MILVDTNVVIHQADDAQAKKLMKVVRKARERAISAVRVFELRRGRRVALDRRRRDEDVASFSVLPFDAACPERSAYLERLLRDRGDPIEVIDLFIAGTALVHRARLATLNVGHFSRVPGLSLVPVPR